MLTNKDDSQVFEAVARGVPGFADYLRRALAQEHENLTALVSADQLRVAQGKAQCLRDLLKRLDSARKG